MERDRENSENQATFAIRLSILEREISILRERVTAHADALALLVNLPTDARTFDKELEDLRGDARDLRQLMSSHDRLRIEEEKLQKVRDENADAQRERIEQKVNHVILGIIAVLVSSLGFFLIQHFTGTP